MKNEQHDELVRNSLTTGVLPGNIRFDKEAAWGRLEQRLPAAKQQRISLYRVAAAACLLLCVATGLYYYLQPAASVRQEPHTVQQKIYPHTILPINHPPTPAPVIPFQPAEIKTVQVTAQQPVHLQATDTAIALAAVPPAADTIAVASVPQPQPAVRKMKTVHISDVYNEEREMQRIMNDHEHMATGRPFIFHSGAHAAPPDNEPLTN